MTRNDKIKLGVAVGAFVIAIIVIALQLFGGPKRSTDTGASGTAPTTEEPQGARRIPPGKKAPAKKK